MPLRDRAALAAIWTVMMLLAGGLLNQLNLAERVAAVEQRVDGTVMPAMSQLALDQQRLSADMPAEDETGAVAALTSVRATAATSGRQRRGHRPPPPHRRSSQRF